MMLFSYIIKLIYEKEGHFYNFLYFFGHSNKLGSASETGPKSGTGTGTHYKIHDPGLGPRYSGLTFMGLFRGLKIFEIRSKSRADLSITFLSLE